MAPFIRPAFNARSSWPAGPLAWSNPRLAARGPALPPVRTAAARAGISFQDNFVSSLQRLYADTFWAVCPDLWFDYTHKNRTVFAGPDCLLINPKTGWVIVLEFKLTYTDAYKQIFLYMSLLRSIFPLNHWKMAGFLIYKQESYRPIMQSGPAEHLLCDEVSLLPFNWEGRGLPTIGILSQNFTSLPIFS